MLNSDLKQKSYLSDEEIEQFFDTPRKARKGKRNKQEAAPAPHYGLKEISPLTRTQAEIFESYFNSNQNMFLHGYAGTGKSFISLYLLMSQMMNDSSFKKLKIVRSTVPSRDQGFLPGSAAEKAKIYEAPYQAIFTELFGRSDAYDYFKRRGLVEFESTSYLRGTTWNDTLVLFDEFQNTSYNEAMTVLTRIGDNCRIIVSGDFHQTDLKRDDEKRGILDIIKILKKVNLVDFFEFKKEDIVRSGFVRELILAEAKYKFEKS